MKRAIASMMVVGLGLVSLAAQAWGTELPAITAPCQTAPHGGVCQVSIPALPSGTGLVVIVEAEASCFPRVVTKRVSDGPFIWSPAPGGVWLTVSGVSYDIRQVPSVARMSFYVHNSGSSAAEVVWLGLGWVCESLTP